MEKITKENLHDFSVLQHKASGSFAVLEKTPNFSRDKDPVALLDIEPGGKGDQGPRISELIEDYVLVTDPVLERNKLSEILP